MPILVMFDASLLTAPLGLPPPLRLPLILPRPPGAITMFTGMPTTMTTPPRTHSASATYRPLQPGPSMRLWPLLLTIMPLTRLLTILIFGWNGGRPWNIHILRIFPRAIGIPSLDPIEPYTMQRQTTF